MRKEERHDDAENDDSDAVDKSSFAFSLMCIFFTVMYSSFAALIFANVSYKPSLFLRRYAL